MIDGAREAALTFRAVADAFPDVLAGALTVVDIGGGSTEIVVATRGVGEVQRQPAARLGPADRALRPPRPAPPRRRSPPSLPRSTPSWRASRSRCRPPTPITLVGVAGTVTSLAAMAEALVSYDPARVHGYRLSQAALAEQVARLRVGTQAARERIVGLDPRRADVILAGALILQRIAAAAAVAEVRVSDRGIRWGLMQELADKFAGQGVA